jgi:hypothetical protein
VAAVYQGLLGSFPRRHEEIAYCRSRLQELQRGLQDPPAPAARPPARVAGRLLLPAGSRTLDEATDHLFQAVTAEQVRDLDLLIQAVLQHQLRGLAHVCLASLNLLPDLEALLQQQAEAFVEARLGGVHVVDVYLGQFGSAERAGRDLAAVYAEAAPQLVPSQRDDPDEVRVLAAPADAAGERFRALVAQALPEVTWGQAVTSDDLVFYREQPAVLFAELPQLGPVALEAYEQIMATEQYNPHARMDISTWQPLPSV